MHAPRENRRNVFNSRWEKYTGIEKWPLAIHSPFNKNYGEKSSPDPTNYLHWVKIKPTQLTSNKQTTLEIPDVCTGSISLDPC